MGEKRERDRMRERERLRYIFRSIPGILISRRSWKPRDAVQEAIITAIMFLFLICETELRRKKMNSVSRNFYTEFSKKKKKRKEREEKFYV